MCVCQFGSRISKMVGPKKQDFWPRINIPKGFFFRSVNDLWLLKKFQNPTLKVNFGRKKSTEFFQKKISIFEPLYFLKLCPIFDELTFPVGIFKFFSLAKILTF